MRMHNDTQIIWSVQQQENNQIRPIKILIRYGHDTVKFVSNSLYSDSNEKNPYASEACVPNPYE